jgi:predicted transcriptional regulator
MRGHMRRSKVEMYLDILTVLSRTGPSKLTHIMYKSNVNYSVLKEYLDFLTKQGLVAEKSVGKRRAIFEITNLGLKTIEEFNHLKLVLPIIEESSGRVSLPSWK